MSENQTDRTNEIRERLAKIPERLVLKYAGANNTQLFFDFEDSGGKTMLTLYGLWKHQDRTRALAEAFAYAPDDIAYLLKENDSLHARIAAVEDAIAISPDDCGRIMHESWTRTKLAQGFHRTPPRPADEAHPCPCPKCHADLIPWDELPEKQKDINRHAFDDVLAEIRRRAARASSGKEVKP